MIATLTAMSISMDGGLQVTITVPREHTDELKALKDEPIDVEIAKHRERRSVTSNSYAWTLIGKIAESMRPPLDKEQVYLIMLKRYGQGTEISVQTSKTDDVKRELDYFEEIGTGEVKGKQFTHFRMWVGSSKYNSAEMSLFISGIVNEAKELGIDTATPNELQRLADSWERRYG